jgi:hypothetical protein
MPPAAPALRYKFSHWRKTLILRTKSHFSRDPPLQEAYRRNPLF